jgi:hypothetical protein
MRASRSLPEGYVHAGTISLAGNRPLFRRLMGLGVIAWIGSLFLFGWIGSLLRPDGWVFDFRSTPAAMIVVSTVGGLVATCVLTLVLHEAAHGLALWVITRERPVFGFKGWYAYTDAPGWYLSRGQIVVAYLAPLVLLTAIGLPLVAFAPAGVSLLVLFAMVMNTVGAIGDVYFTVLVLRIKGPVIFGDGPDDKTGESGSWFVPAATAEAA